MLDSRISVVHWITGTSICLNRMTYEAGSNELNRNSGKGCGMDEIDDDARCGAWFEGMTGLGRGGRSG